MLRSTYVLVRRVIVFVLGMSIVLVGVVMLVTPGPAVVVIPAGLALLATEFLWARRLLRRLKDSISSGDYFPWGKKDTADGHPSGKPGERDGDQGPRSGI